MPRGSEVSKKAKSGPRGCRWERSALLGRGGIATDEEDGLRYKA